MFKNLKSFNLLIDAMSQLEKDASQQDILKVEPLPSDFEGNTQVSTPMRISNFSDEE